MLIAALAAAAIVLNRPPSVAGECRTVHGRLNVWNGGTPLKIWVVGTHHLLGVQNTDENGENLPHNVIQALDSRADRFDVSIFADFRVCATRRYRPGHMQPVKLVEAKHIRVERR